MIELPFNNQLLSVKCITFSVKKKKKNQFKVKAIAIQFLSPQPAKVGVTHLTKTSGDYDKWSSMLLPSLPLVVRDLRAMILLGKQSKIESTQERRVKCDCSLV